MSGIPAELRFWGIRGSLASNPSRFGNNTSCVEIDLGNQTSIFLDAGSGIRAASLHRTFRKIYLFLSHFHWDHIQGLPFLTALSDTSCPIEIISGFPDIRERLLHLFDDRFHPVALKEYESHLTYRHIKPNESAQIEGLHASTAALNHPGTSYALKLSGSQLSFLYATDSDYDPVPSEASKLFHNADIAVMDSQFLVGDALSKSDYGHSSFKQAIDTCARFHVRRCILYHIDPNYDDTQLESMVSQAQSYVRSTYQQQGPRVDLAREAQTERLFF